MSDNGSMDVVHSRNDSPILLVALVSAATGAMLVAGGFLGALLGNNYGGLIGGAAVAALLASPLGIFITGAMTKSRRRPARFLIATIGGWVGLLASIAAIRTPVGRVLSALVIVLPGLGALAADRFAQRKEKRP